jgi:glyceraldehyde 3-phosphate dehydrogenase
VSTRVAINGLGRIGRAMLKLVMDEPSLELVAVNDVVDAENLAYLLRFDMNYGRYSRRVTIEAGNLVIDGHVVRTLNVHDPLQLPRSMLQIELVFECTGKLARRQDLEMHLRAGAKRVVLSAPEKGGEVATLVHGVNTLDGNPALISCASCTTNCITPVVEILGRRIGIRKAVMTTVHAYTASQSLVDGPRKGFRYGRAAGANLIPASTGAALATVRALPQYAGLFDGIAVRAPVPVGSIADITFVTARATTVAEVNGILTDEAVTARYAGVLGVSQDPLVSSDVIGDSRVSIIDLELTRVVDGDLVKVMSWYDNEWGYANQMLRAMVSAGSSPPAA